MKHQFHRPLPFLLCLLLLIAGMDLRARTVTLFGEITAPQDKYITFAQPLDLVSGEMKLFKASLNSDNSFRLSMDLGEEEWLEVRHADISFEIYLARGKKDFGMEFDGSDQYASMLFLGEAAEDNRHLHEFRHLHGWSKWDEAIVYADGGLETLVDPEISRQAKAYAAEDYLRVLQSVRDYERRDLYGRSNVSRNLFQYLNQAINWRMESNKLVYFLMNKAHIPVKEFSNYWRQFNMLQEVDLSDGSTLRYLEYRNLLSAFLQYLHLESPSKADRTPMAFYQFAAGNLTNKPKYFMQAMLMLDNFRRKGDPRLAQRKFKAFEQSNPFPEYTKVIRDYMGERLQYLPEKMVPDFQVEGLGEERIRLSDYRGKVVYVSFWASWCGPCLRGFRETDLIRRQLEEKGVVFLNINFDDNPQIWKRALTKNNLPGTNVFPLELSAFQSEFKVAALPFYLLINKEGKQRFLAADDLNFATDEFTALLNE